MSFHKAARVDFSAQPYTDVPLPRHRGRTAAGLTDVHFQYSWKNMSGAHKDALGHHYPQMH